MKKISTSAIIALLFICSHANAQYIPDNGFAQGISNACPTCIDAGHNLTANAQTLTSLSINNSLGITDLTGLDGFTNLQTFICRAQYITNFPALPPSLISLTCDYNELTSLPAFPLTLQHLNCGDNFLTALPTLPASLRYLNIYTNGITTLPSLPSSCDTILCAENPLTALPTLPSTLKWLQTEYASLNSLPALPASLEYLTCSNNNLGTLPTLPNSLTHLEAENNYLTSLPSLPSSLTVFTCRNNLLTSLPVLPDAIVYLDVAENQLTSLPSLPSSLNHFDCSENMIGSLPALPTALIELFASENELSEMPLLPSGLIHLECELNHLTSLPDLPNSLHQLYVGGNQITMLPPLNPNLNLLQCSYDSLVHLPSLPASLVTLTANNCSLVDVPPLPAQLQTLYLQNNSIASLPELPEALWQLGLSNNPISCLPFLPQYLNVLTTDGTNIICIPNLPSLYYYNFNLPICEAGNMNGCMAYPTISGNVYGDFNSNGVHDNGEYPAGHAVVQANPGGYVGISDSAGNYKIAVPLATTDTARATEYSVYYNAPLTFYTATFDTTSGQQSLNNDFGMLAVNSGANLDVSIVTPQFRPGFNTNLYVTIKNVGTTSIDGSVTVTFDPVLTFISADQGGTSSANTVTWNFNGLNPFQTKMLTAVMNCPPIVLIGMTLNNEVSGTLSGQTDIELGNNTVSIATEVVGSYDPNDKEVNDAILTPDELSNGKYLEYTIHFQNTGTAPATFITVVDTLSDKLDATTFEMIAASHHYDITLANDLTEANHPVFVKWLFNNIQLPDSSVDFLASQGFVQFRIKPRSDVLIGDEIQNTAGIYFDFNEPVITNAANTAVAVSDGNHNIADHHFTATMFPNPTASGTTIHFDNITSQQLWLQVINELGAVVMEKTISITGTSANVNLDLKKFASGIYTVIVKSSDELQVMKLVKE